MSKIKHRTLVHIALNAKGQRVGHLLCVAGKYIPLSSGTKLSKYRNDPPSYWLGQYYGTAKSVQDWKQNWLCGRGVSCFQRVMLVGGEE